MKPIKLTLIIILFVLFFDNLKSQTSITTIDNGFQIDFTLPSYTIKDTNIFEVYGINQIYSFIDIPQLGNMSDIGYPSLPQLTIDLHIPNSASTFNVSISNKTTEIKNLSYKVLPAQDDDEEITPAFSIENNYYSSSGALYAFSSQIADTFNIMGANGISFTIFPFQYNPSLNRIEVIKSCRFTLTHNGSSSLVLKNATVNNTIQNRYLSHIFENYPTLAPKSGSLDKGRYLIITAPIFESSLTPFVNYKKNLGYNVIVVNTSTSGTTASSIKTYLQTLYNSSSTRPNFVLLVGDIDQIPASGGSINGEYEDPLTDLNYTRLSGDDYFADVFLGRWPIATVLQLQNIMHKTIYMETHLDVLDRKAILLAGGGPGLNQFDNPQRWVMDKVLNPKGFEHDFYFAVDGATRTDALNALNGDYTLFIYRGHGSFTQIGSPFDLYGNDVDVSTNSVFPFGFSFACNTNNFGNPGSQCFGERWIRSSHGGISYFGASTSTYRNTNNVIEKRVFANMDNRDQLAPFICLGMKDYYKRFWSWLSGKRRKRHIKSYNLLGDPSIFLYGLECQENISFNSETFNSGDNIIYHASNSIIAPNNGYNFLIKPGSEVNLVAGTEIILRPGFSASYGSIFNASLGPCNFLESDDLVSKNYVTEFDESIELMPEPNTNIQNVVTCFPNPTRNDLNLYFKINTSKLQSISIIDLKGNTVIYRTIDNFLCNEWNLIKINTSSLENGQYFYLIKYENGYERGKFIKNN